jgi:hypothetical protein
MWPSSATYLKGLGFTPVVVWQRHAGLMPPPEPKKGLKCGYKLGAEGRKRGEINKKPSPASRDRLPSPHHFIWGRLGRGVWRSGLGVLSRPAGCWRVLRPPWRLCPTWNRPGVLLEGPPRTPPWLEGPPPPMWGDRGGP